MSRSAPTSPNMRSNMARYLAEISPNLGNLRNYDAAKRSSEDLKPFGVSKMTTLPDNHMNLPDDDVTRKRSAESSAIKVSQIHTLQDDICVTVATNVSTPPNNASSQNSDKRRSSDVKSGGKVKRRRIVCTQPLCSVNSSVEYNSSSPVNDSSLSKKRKAIEIEKADDIVARRNRSGALREFLASNISTMVKKPKTFGEFWQLPSNPNRMTDDDTDGEYYEDDEWGRSDCCGVQLSRCTATEDPVVEDEDFLEFAINHPRYAGLHTIFMQDTPANLSLALRRANGLEHACLRQLKAKPRLLIEHRQLEKGRRKYPHNEFRYLPRYNVLNDGDLLINLYESRVYRPLFLIHKYADETTRTK